MSHSSRDFTALTIVRIDLSRRLGHTKASITLAVDGHLIPDMQHKAAALMDELTTPVEIGLHPVAPSMKKER